MKKNHSNSVVILCGGEGTRMREETEFKPKPLVQVGNKPVIWHIMKIYSHYGYNNFVLTLGYRGNMIKEYFLNARAYNNNFTLNTKTGNIEYHSDENDDFIVTFVDTGLETNTGERVRRAAKHLQGDHFLLTYGDGVSDVNIDDLVSFHKKKRKLVTLTGVRPPSKFGLIKVDDSMTATEFRQKPILSDFVNGGFMVLQKEFIKHLTPDAMIEDDIIRLCQERQEIAVFEHNGFWQAMDTYREMVDLNKIWNTTAPWKVW